MCTAILNYRQDGGHSFKRKMWFYKFGCLVSLMDQLTEKKRPHLTNITQTGKRKAPLNENPEREK